MKPVVIAALMALAASPAAAGVRESGPDHFTIVHTAFVGGSPDAQWAAPIDWAGWWPDSHTWSGSAANLDLDPEADGELEEEWGNGNSVLHGNVLNAQPGRLLRMAAPFGALPALPVQAILDIARLPKGNIALAPQGKGTRVTLTHRVAGAPQLKLDRLAPAVDAAMAEGFARLIVHTPAPRPADPAVEADPAAKD